MIGRLSYRVRDLRRGPFRAAGLLWTLEDASGVVRQKDGVAAFELALSVLPHHRAGLARQPDVSHDLALSVPHTSDVENAPLGFSREFDRWAIYPETEHVGVCGVCERLWPCDHQARGLAHERSRVLAAQPYCEKCRTDVGHRMSISFGDIVPISELVDNPGWKPRVEGLRLVLDGDTHDTFVEQLDRPVYFCGRVGACRNAAYRWAAENGWVIPVGRDDNGGREWKIRGVRSPSATADGG